MVYFIQGLLLGIAYVAPIGVQNLFVINTALTQRKNRIYTTAAIVAFFDISLSIACFFGIGVIMSTNKWLELIVLGIGSLVVIYIGISLLRADVKVDSDTNVAVPVTKVVITACIVTWFNPQALIDGTMLLGASKASIPAEDGLKFILGVCFASLSWWFGISTVFSLFRAKITEKLFRIINIICGVFIVFYGIKLLVSFIKLIMEIIGYVQ